MIDHVLVDKDFVRGRQVQVCRDETGLCAFLATCVRPVIRYRRGRGLSRKIEDRSRFLGQVVFEESRVQYLRSLALCCVLHISKVTDWEVLAATLFLFHLLATQTRLDAQPSTTTSRLLRTNATSTPVLHDDQVGSGWGELWSTSPSHYYSTEPLRLLVAGRHAIGKLGRDDRAAARAAHLQ